MEFCKLSPATLMLCNLLLAVSSEASVWIVTGSHDSTQTNSLRGAIIAANARARSLRSNTILLGSPRWPDTVSTFQLTIGGADETNAFTGDLEIVRGNLTIVGIGKNVTIDARVQGPAAICSVLWDTPFCIPKTIPNARGATPSPYFRPSRTLRPRSALSWKWIDRA